MVQVREMPPEPGGCAAVRCPICVAYANALLRRKGKDTTQPDRIIRRATCKDRIDLAIHLVTEHNWKPRV